MNFKHGQENISAWNEDSCIYSNLRYYREVGVNIGEARDLHQYGINNIKQYKRC